MRRLVCSLHPSCFYARRIDQTLCVVWKTVGPQLGTHTQAKMSEVSLLIRKQEKKMTEVLVKKTHFTHVEVERLFQIYRCFFQFKFDF